MESNSFDIENNAEDYMGFVKKLIAVVSQHPQMYDKKHDGYFSKPDRDKTWCEIAKAVGQCADDCRRRWKLLRERFAKELQKRERVSGGKAYTSDWSCFDKLMFLKEHIAPRGKKYAGQPLDRNVVLRQNKLNKSKPNNIHPLDASYISNIGTGTNLTEVLNNNQNMPGIKLVRLPSSTNLSSNTNASNTLDIKEEHCYITNEPIEDHIDNNDNSIDGPCLQDDLNFHGVLEETPAEISKDNAVVSTVEDGDILFGRLVTSMLRDIPLEMSKDDVKLEVMQLLIRAKRKRRRSNNDGKDT